MLEQPHFHLRGYRKRANLTQRELAYLLGHASEVAVSKYETRRRGYSLNTALRLQVIFGTPVGDLFSDYCAKVELEVIKRARELCIAVDTSDRPRDLNRHKQVFLSNLIAGEPSRAQPRKWEKKKNTKPSSPYR